MLSTYLSYNLVTRDMSKSLERVAADPVTARDHQYYRETIGKVATIDEFLDDYRLFSYAMKAYGLEEMTYAKAFMREVLESDLDDEESFANKLQDERYKSFAAAFNFNDETAATNAIDLQSELQEEETVGLYSRSMQEEASGYSREYEYYKARIGQITSVDEFVADDRLAKFALSAVGLETRYYSAGFLRDVLVSDPNDPGSLVNQLEDVAYKELAELFNFEADGSLASGVPAQDDAQIKTITESYIFDVPDRIIPQAAEMHTAYFEDAIANLTSVDDLIADTRLVDYLTTAYNLPMTLTRREDLRAALTSDLSDPASFANSHDHSGYQQVAQLFNFEADGSLAAGVSAQTAEQTGKLTSVYMAAYDNAGEKRDASETAYFRSATEVIFSVDDLLKNTRVYEYALRAYGLDPETQSRETIRRVLTSDMEDPFSFANRQTDERYRALATAFNFNADGRAIAARVAQSQPEVDDLSKTYFDRIDLLEISEDEAEEETRYYREEINLVDSLDAFLADERLVNFMLDANGIDRSTVDNQFLRDVFTSELDDEESFVNQLDNRAFRMIAASFNFNPDGSIAREQVFASQSMADMIETQEKYLRQSLEIEAGMENEGVRLALYFQRMAPGITSAYDILADPALQEVVRVALGLPAEMAASDIDAQARAIESRIEIADFTDPEKLEEFITRFSTLFDLENNSAPSMVTTLFGNGGSALGADMLMSLAQINSRGF